MPYFFLFFRNSGNAERIIGIVIVLATFSFLTAPMLLPIYLESRITRFSNIESYYVKNKEAYFDII